jgi:hypothetical protein
VAFEELSPKEQRIVLQCMKVITETSLIEDAEFQTRLGLSKQELHEVVAAWPRLDNSGDASIMSLAINNCLNEVCHGVYINGNTWRHYFDVSLRDVEQVYDRWLNLKRNNI